MSAFNLLETGKSFFNNELISKASASLGESEGSITKALSAIVPSLISTVADKTSTAEGAASVLQAATDQHKSGIADTLSSFFHPATASTVAGQSTGLIAKFFGNGQSNILTSLVSNFSGIKSGSTGTLISMALPALLGMIGRHATQNNLSATELGNVLQTQKAEAVNNLPAGFSLSSFNNPDTLRNLKNTAVSSVENAGEKASSALKWIAPLLIVVAVAVLAFYLFRNGCNKSATVTPNSGDSTLVAPAVAKGAIDSLTGDYNYNEGAVTVITLPDAVQISAGANSTEARLVSFLNDKDAPIDTVKGNWFEFTNVHFKTGSFTLTDASLAQLKNMAAITKAYPLAKFKLGGYTDNTGDATANVTLSQKRADAVDELLVKLGAPAAAVESTKGYGELWPIADNATAEGRVINRRVAVNVKSK